MSLSSALLPEFDHEMATTRRLLERVPPAELGWRPHPRSMTLGQLIHHLANLPMWCRETLEHPAIDLDTFGGQVLLADPVSREAVLRDFDTRVAAARQALADASDAHLLAMWTLRKGPQEVFSMPRISAIRSFVMNHLVHHRGQLSVYLRLKDVPLPPIYGPSADEQ